MYQKRERDLLEQFIESLRQYRRYELSNKNKSLISDVYVDPLPNDGVLKRALNKNTCFFIGRKGTGKSTVFLVAQEKIRANSKHLAVYIDVKSVYESAKLMKIEIKKYVEMVGEDGYDHIRQYLLHKNFLSYFMRELVKELTKHIKIGILERLFTNRERRVEKAVQALQDWSCQVLEQDTYRDIPLLVETKTIQKEASNKQRKKEQAGSLSVDAKLSWTQLIGNLSANVKAASSLSESDETSLERRNEFTSVLSLYFDIKSLLGHVADELRASGFERLYLFLDDFSELDDDAQKMFVDILVNPLNSWSNEFYKLKIAAYPGRLYYGEIDRSKIDEVFLDFYALYSSKNINDLEQKAVDFTRRMLERRSQVYLKRDFLDYVDGRFRESFYEEFFKATMNNPRRIGHILLDCYNTQIVHGKAITMSAFHEATIRLYEKDESVFSDSSVVQHSFGDRLAIQAHFELLKEMKNKARNLKATLPKSGSEFFRGIKNVPTSHFVVNNDYESLLHTLEHNFFLTKYHDLSNRDGTTVTVYCLNYGLCQKNKIVFGRPNKTDQGKYFTERAFNYTPTIKEFLRGFVEIKCTNPECGKTQTPEALPWLKRFGMSCPECRQGTCEQTFTYAEVVREIDRRFSKIQLPEEEFEILRVLYDNPTTQWSPKTIGAEVDKRYQAVARNARKLISKSLLTKSIVVIEGRSRVVYSLTKSAIEDYFMREVI